jgi:hypothetical protein
LPSARTARHRTGQLRVVGRLTAAARRRPYLPGQQAFRTGPPAMSSTETSTAPRFLHTLVAGFAGVLAAALFLGVFDGGLPRPVHAEVALAAAPAAPAAPRAPGLCFHGAGGELLDFAPAGQGCR